jgi:hypothetical protein
VFKRQPGPKSKLDEPELAWHVAFALGAGMNFKQIADTGAINSSTAWRYATKMGLTEDKRCLELAHATNEWLLLQEERKKKAENQDPIWDPGLDLPI